MFGLGGGTRLGGKKGGGSLSWLSLLSMLGGGGLSSSACAAFGINPPCAERAGVFVFWPDSWRVLFGSAEPSACWFAGSGVLIQSKRTVRGSLRPGVLRVAHPAFRMARFSFLALVSLMELQSIFARSWRKL